MRGQSHQQTPGRDPATAKAVSTSEHASWVFYDTPTHVQSAQLAAKQQAEQADTSARLAALEAERAALQAKLAAEKARASEALTLEQLKQQHNERWWFTKQVLSPCH